MKSFDVVCIGVVLLDLPVGPVDEHFFYHETTMVDRIRLTTGGDAFNEAVILSRLGKKTALIGHIGKDMAGEMIVKRCAEEGIHYEGMLIDPEAETRINIAMIDQDGQRRFLKTQTKVSGSFLPEEIDFSLIKSSRAVSLASIFSSKLRNMDTILQIVQTAREHQTVTFADMVPMTGGEGLKDIEKILPYIDYFLPNLEEARLLTGKNTPDEMADCLLQNGVGNVMIKLGKDGCLIKSEKERYRLLAYPAQVIDTTGAGDNFAAAFIASALDGKSLRDCGSFAAAAAAISTEAAGAVEAVKNKQQIEAYQAENREIYS
ncbi:carbohydrate kinase family protein [Anoxybacterium hadale]|uniref:carbohydrate kinase family protein n=1 Tax=Anoxybacterium hadale TaxID=3408580 RepID=UPI003B00E838